MFQGHLTRDSNGHVLAKGMLEVSDDLFKLTDNEAVRQFLAEFLFAFEENNLVIGFVGIDL